MGAIDSIKSWGAKALAGLTLIGGITFTQGCGTMNEYQDLRNPPVEVMAEQPYDVTDDSLTDDAFNEMLESTYKIKATAEYKEATGFLDPEDIMVSDEIMNKYMDMMEFSDEDESDSVIEANWHGTGSAFASSDDETYFLTAQHVAKPQETIQKDGKFYKLEEYSLSYLDKDGEEVGLEYEFGSSVKEKDIAVLSGDEIEDVYSKLASADKIDRGDYVGHAGFPYDVDLNLTFGRITELRQADHYFLTDMHISPGDSGSPVYVFKDGEPLLAGTVNWSYAQRHAQAINGISRIDGIVEMLENNGMDVTGNETEQEVEL